MDTPVTTPDKCPHCGETELLETIDGRPPLWFCAVCAKVWEHGRAPRDRAADVLGAPIDGP